MAEGVLTALVLKTRGNIPQRALRAFPGTCSVLDRWWLLLFTIHDHGAEIQPRSNVLEPFRGLADKQGLGGPDPGLSLHKKKDPNNGEAAGLPAADRGRKSLHVTKESRVRRGRTRKLSSGWREQRGNRVKDPRGDWRAEPVAVVRKPGHESASYLQSLRSSHWDSQGCGPPGSLRTLSPPHGDHQPCAAGTLPLLH